MAKAISSSSVEDGGAKALGGLRGSSLVLGLALVVVAGFPGSASAALTGRQVVQASAAFSSANKTATATCPAGKQVTGGGAEIFGVGFEGQVAINDVIPNAALTSVTVQGLEDQNGFAGNWALLAFAICATPPPGLERVIATSPSDSVNKSVTAVCPAGKRVLGAGGDISLGGGQVVLDELTPTSSLTSVRVSGFEDQDGTLSNWLVRAYAICANPVGGLERIVATSPTDSTNDNKRLFAFCSPGKEPVGAGAELGGGGGGQVLLNDLTLSTNVRVEGHEDQDGSSSNWLVRAYAICAATSERVVGTSPSDSDDKSGSARCSFGKLLTGVGGDITGGSGQALIERLSVLSDLEHFFAFGVEDETGTLSNWVVRTYGICATPPPGLERVLATSPTDSLDKSVTAPCPAGKRVVGAAGGTLSGGGEVMLSAIAPNQALTSVTVTGEEDQNGFASDWSVAATAICATPPPALELVSAAGDPDSDSAAGVTATCPAGKNLLGTGAEITDGAGEVLLDDLRPNAALTTVTVTGFEDENGFVGDWFLRAHAICANP
jgi:hypothetical protein